MNDRKHSILDPSSESIRVLLDEVAAENRLWSADDLRDVLNHQWSAPLAVDLSGLTVENAERVEMLATSKGLLLRSFGDLLEHPHPPLSLLVLTKEFAKRCLSSSNGAVPHDVARVLYFASIATALDRCSLRITKLGDKQIADGISWALSLDWIPTGARGVLAAGSNAITGTEKPSS
ncbi:MAG: hypothetical protein HQ559_03910 [Lentisphaerae bacterium]|nr:hypothetical protein [Lentisphaerota bacterium]